MEGAMVGDEHQDIARGVEYGRAMTAVGQVLFYIVTQVRCYRVVDVIRNLMPHMFAV
jgi:hypothetical protein